MRCVVSFSDNAGHYRGKMQRLEQSLKGRFNGDFLGFTSYEEINCEHHKVIPYKFKAASIMRAVQMGYDQILWCDSPIHATQDLEPVFNHLDKFGYMFFDNIGHSLGKWTNQKALDYFKMTREEANQVKMIMACCMGFDVRLQFVKDLIFEYYGLANELYPGSWGDHRHDQTVMSFLLHQYEYDILVGQDTFFAYKNHHGVLPIASTVCLISE